MASTPLRENVTTGAKPPSSAVPPDRAGAPYELVRAPEVLLGAPLADPNAESFQRLASLLVAESGGSSRVVVVTSALPGEGKSFVALNLALALGARNGERVLLVDADLRRAEPTAWLSPPPSRGLADVLQIRMHLDGAIVSLRESPLRIMPRGRAARDAAALMDSEECRGLFVRLRERFDWIVVDTPPVTPFGDATALGRLSDGVLVVARAGVTPVELYSETLALLEGTRVLGVVLNDLAPNIVDGRSHYHYYYSRYYQRKKEQAGAERNG